MAPIGSNSYNIPLVHVDAEELFLSGLAGGTHPEAKPKFIGATFFDEEACKVGGADFLAHPPEQGHVPEVSPTAE